MNKNLDKTAGSSSVCYLPDIIKEGIMPTYEYRCLQCNHKFSLVQTVAERDKAKAACPSAVRKK